MDVRMYVSIMMKMNVIAALIALVIVLTMQVIVTAFMMIITNAISLMIRVIVYGSVTKMVTSNVFAVRSRKKLLLLLSLSHHS